ncbi:hypothetical protein P3L10_028745 [Capsicum annuum]
MKTISQQMRTRGYGVAVTGTGPDANYGLAQCYDVERKLLSGGSSSRGVGAFIGIGVWKNKQIEKKRKGANDAEKLVEILQDISLNFKYSTLDKATG